MVLGGGIIRTVFADFRFIHVKALGQRRYGALHIFFFSFISLQSRIRLYTFSLTASFVPLESRISPLEGNRPAGILLLGKDLLLYCSPLSRLIRD